MKFLEFLRYINIFIFKLRSEKKKIFYVLLIYREIDRGWVGVNIEVNIKFLFLYYVFENIFLIRIYILLSLEIKYYILYE